MKRSSQFKKSFPYLIIFSIISVIFWIWLVGMFVKPSRAQKLNIFVGTKTANISLIEERVNINDYNNLLMIDFKNIPTDNMLMMYFTSVGQSECDIFIIKDNDFNDKFNEFYNCFLPLNNRLEINEMNNSYIEKEGSILGVKMDDNLFVDSSNYYLFVSKQSPHIKSNSTGSTDNYLFKIIQDLI